MKKYNFEKGLKIDRYNLPEELVQQPQLYMEWALKEAKAANEREWKKHELELLKAEVEKEIRKDPKQYGIKSITESAVKAAIALHPKVKKKTKSYLEALQNERVLGKAEKAYKTRQNMLEGLVKLNVQLNFAEVSVPRQYKEMRDTQAKDSIRGSLKRKGIKRR